MNSRILNKIKQCLALAKSSKNEHEAAAAMRTAQSLMRKHKIDESDVNLSHVQHEKVQTDSKQVIAYHGALLNVIKSAFGVQMVLSRHVYQGFEISFVGIYPQAELALYCYHVLWPKLQQARASYVKQQPKQCKRQTKVLRGDQFAEGWVYGIKSQVNAFANSDTENAIITQYMAKHFPNLESSKSNKRGAKKPNFKALSDGVNAGQKESINRPVNGQELKKLSA